jgi:hypothetical protein
MPTERQSVFEIINRRALRDRVYRFDLNRVIIAKRTAEQAAVSITLSVDEKKKKKKNSSFFTHFFLL